jgi:DNA-binding response OmpR family regulator
MLLDLKLPGISGFEVAHTLKITAITSDIPIIAMTGHYTEEERKYAINICGIKRCLTKPLDIEKLFEEIDGNLD